MNRNISVIPIRGNVDTRIRKIESENLDGVILAYAGVVRAGYGNHIKEILSLDVMVPPSGQGAIGVETRNEEALLSFLNPINDDVSFREVSIERSLQVQIGGGCNVPLGINACIKDHTLVLHVIFGTETGEILVRDRQDGDVGEAERMIANVASKITQRK